MFAVDYFPPTRRRRACRALRREPNFGGDEWRRKLFLSILGDIEMAGPFPDHDADVLISRFEQHAEQLRHLDLYDVKIAGGFLTVQLILASWFANKPFGDLLTRLLLIAIDAAFWVVCWNILRASHKMRRRARDIMEKINRALKLNEAGTYLDEPIYSDLQSRPFRAYEIGLAVSFIGAALIVLTAK
jgi:hypothetical protein